MAKLAALAAVLGNVGDTLDKVKTEVTESTATLQKTIDDLKAQLAAGTDPSTIDIPDDAQAALDRLTAVADSLDEINPDDPSTPPDTGDGGDTTPPVDTPPQTIGARLKSKGKK